MATPDYYTVLKVPNTASHDEIKRAYYALSRIVHPDKKTSIVNNNYNSNSNSSKECGQLDVEFHQLSVAWEILGDAARRKAYDQRVKAVQNRALGVVQDEIDLDDMDFDEDSGTYSFPCRCSGRYSIAESDLEAGREIAPCVDCSLKIKVLYEAADDNDE
ncbi:hypothetical protein BX661DRAFT_178601 [Kickxella alabastrina]|uniref:uncharacterized protein n=1 Tax=Kickxella alabastrina TaxID=61397 RepID=UPI00221F823A|nr:uncharacterized protein BX661DRAFT_178601 [Kickxella alabastrina]KAI7833552.1 hypothetical protein BX661DRAFT_178601 [Kickxella alabastrina]KAJ1931626.1 hypothetical protein GGF37_007330 [Kickxella alabastrina]